MKAGMWCFATTQFHVLRTTITGGSTYTVMFTTPLSIGEFMKVSYDHYWIDSGSWGEYDELVRKEYDAIRLPQRATSGSAGHDFYLPVGLVLEPGQSAKIPTGIRVRVDDGWWLAILPRSSLGFKYRVQLDNTCGVIDQDYFGSDNEGHIFIKITNDSRDGKTLHLEAGQAFAQGIFLPYGITYSDDANAVRNGGIGSTNKN